MLQTIMGWVGTFGGVGAALAVAWFVPGPFRKYALAAALGIALIGGFYLKVRHDAQVEIIARIEKEKEDAITKANAARERIRSLCTIDPTNCVPDDWFRD